MEKIIRKYVKKILFEIDKSSKYYKHFKDRKFDRLLSAFTNFPLGNEGLREKLLDKITELEKIEYPGQDNIGILLYRGGSNYLYRKNGKDGKPEKSEGNNIWIVARGNDYNTIVFGNNTYKPKNTQIWITADDLLKYIKHVKNGNYNLSPSDIRFFANPLSREKKSPEKEKTDIVVKINGTKWVILPEKEEIYKKNNREEKYNIFDFFDNFDISEEKQDEILNYIVNE